MTTTYDLSETDEQRGIGDADDVKSFDLSDTAMQRGIDAERLYAQEFSFVLGAKSASTKIARTLVKAAHQAQHRRMERKMQRAMVPFFKKAVRSIASSLDIPADATREQADRAIERAFDQEKLDKLLADTAGPVLADGFIEGAQAERMLVAAAMRRRRSLEEQAGKASTATDALGGFDDDDLDGLDIPTEYPDWLREEAQDFVLRSFREPYWQRINQTTRDDIQLTLWRAIEDGLSIRDIATRIMEQHGAAYSRARATNVARTEMTGAMNSGHTEAIRQAYEDIPGIEAAKELLSVLGTTTRPTHAEADGQQRPIDEDFDIGGYPAAYPGDARLPPEERCGCQCHHPDNVLIGNVLGALRTRYSGNMAEVVTALGRRFTVTVNHPVPTANRGMVAAGELKKGDDLLLYDGPLYDPASGMAAGDDEQHEPATAREICELIFASAPLDAIEVRVSLENDLHGDGRFSGPEIEVVLPHRHLRDERELVPQGEHGELCLAAVDVGLVPLAGASTLAERVGTPSGSDSVLHASKVPFMRASGPCACYTFGPCANWYSSLAQNAAKSAFATVKFLRQCYEALAGRVSGDDVRDVRIFHYDGPVYEFQTRNGTIFANGVLVSNCTIISAFVGEGLSDNEKPDEEIATE